MFKIIAVTNRRLCAGDFVQRVNELTALGIDVILREKDMAEDEYSALLARMSGAAAHSFVRAARENGVSRLHLPLYMLRESPEAAKEFYTGVSIHSPEEAKEAQLLGARYVIAGNVYETDCKKGLPGKGPDYIRAIKSAVDIPVYAIGGITKDNIQEVKNAGADGACIMSGFMRCLKAADAVKEIEDVLYRS